jgi:hypothetical protein
MRASRLWGDALEDAEEAGDTPKGAEIQDAPEAPDTRDVKSAPDTAVTAAPHTALPVAEPAPRARRRGRTAALLGAAVVLGLVAGTCVGHLFPNEARQDDVRIAAYDEAKPYGAEQVRLAYLAAGDTFALIVQSRKGGAPAVPFQQTVTPQSRLLG